MSDERSAGGSSGRGVSDEELIAAAGEAREESYSPYSGFGVGAALGAADGRVFTGCNVENSSYGLTVCAERLAAWRAVSEGCTDWTKLAVVADAAEPAVPCGACLQVLSEFAPDLDIVLANLGGQVVHRTLRELLPQPFVSEKDTAARRAGGPGPGGD